MLINFTFRSWCSSQKSFGHCPNAFPSLSTYHKNQRDRIIFQSSRTNIRSRFQRWKASSFGHNVSKGSRQNSTVTLGKGVALERGELSGKRSLDWTELLTERECWSARVGVFGLLVVLRFSISYWGGGGFTAASFFHSFQVTLNQELMLTRRIRLFN